MRRLYIFLATLVIPTAVTAATPSQLASAEGAIRAVYKKFVTEAGDYRKAPWSPEITRWLARDDVVANGEIRVFDYSPFCDCQDGGYKIPSVKAVSTGPSTARLTAVLFVDRPIRFVYDLRLLGGHWVIEDIHSRDVPSLLEMLRTNVPRAEKRRR